MKTIIAVCLTLLVSSSLGDDEVCIGELKKEVCTKSETLKDVIQHQFERIRSLKLRVKPNKTLTICPYTFKNFFMTDIEAGVYDENQRSRSSLSLVRDSFAGMLGLMRLELFNIDLGLNNEDALASVWPTLESLDIERSNLTEVPTHLLTSAVRLKHLALKKNQISVIRSNSFSSQKSLRYLDLEYNRISYIESGAFDGLLTLNLLFLHGNSFGHIPNGLFKNVKLLEYLGLGNCGIKTIAPGAFDGLYLDFLDLSVNNITAIKTDTFNGLSVEALDLGYNQIEELEPKAFSGISVTLELTNNQLRRIDSDDFEGLNILYLGLSNNKIQAIAPHAFVNVVMQCLDLFNSSLPLISRTELGLRKSVRLRTE